MQDKYVTVTGNHGNRWGNLKRAENTGACFKTKMY